MSNATAALIESLTARGSTLAVAESLTGGALTSELIRIPGASAVVNGGVVAYATALKASVLGVNRALLAEYGPVHPQVAEAMAQGVREVLAVDERPATFGVATTGVAGPEAQGNAPVGCVYIAVADARGAQVREFRFDGDRASIRAQTVQAALALLQELLASRE